MNDKYGIYKGNLGDGLKQDIIEVLREMLNSDKVEERSFAVQMFLSHKKELSDWPESHSYN